ncbi:unnamed protein product [Rhodiola kirilowii]
MSLPSVERVYVTEEFVRELKNGNPNFKLPEPVPMLRFLYELCSSVVFGDMPVQKCKAALELVDFSDKALNEDLSSILADVVTQMAQDLTIPGEPRGRLVKLAKGLAETQIVPMRLFHERCEEEFLWEAEMIKIKAQDLKGKEVRVNTRLLYQQTKFNLLREESEGYAKLITLLCGSSDDSSNNKSVSEATIGIIKSLIGHFDLDPNRVFDIVLECFELQPIKKIFLELIPLFPKSHAAQILGFKFQYYQHMDVSSTVPFGLYQLTALLVKEDFIDLDSICAHMLPKDEDAFEHHNILSSKRLDEANKIGKINLAATGKDLMEDDKPGDVTIDLFAALNIESEAVVERLPELETNQSLGLLLGFLAVHDWYHANILFDRLSPINPVAHNSICKGLFRLIDNFISPSYELIRREHLQNCGVLLSASFDGAQPIEMSTQRATIDLSVDFFQMLACAGPYLHRDTILLQKVCRVLRSHYLSALEKNALNEDMDSEAIAEQNRLSRLRLREARFRVEEALGKCLLPSLQFIPANPAVGQEIWEVMALLPYEVRYRLYGEWDKEDEQNPMVLVAKQTAKLDTRRILKRLAKENLKQLGRMVAKLAHANPMTVLRTIIHQIEAYRDMITPVVDAFKYLTQLEYDILEYVVIERLAQRGRPKLKEDGLNLSDWLQSLASFWGHLCKKYPSMELRGLFQYLVNQLKKGEGVELVVLQELIQQMANVQYTENLTEEQLDAMAGGETLRYQATAFGVARNNKALVKSTNRLRDSLLAKDEPKLALPLLLLIAQHRSLVIINADAPYIKMVSEQFDRCHGTLLQYVEFLCSAVTPATAYAQLIPSLDKLIHSYHLEPEVAFLIYRPVLRLFKCRGDYEVFWPLDDSETTRVSSEENNTELSGNPRDLVLDLGPSQETTLWSDLLGTVKTMLPLKSWNSLSPDLYATFWGLTLYDLYVPRNRYESEISKQHAALKALEELLDNSNSAITKRKKEKERIQDSLDRLTNELQKHEKNVASVRRRLAREKDKWLSSCPDTLKINMEFLQRCIFPRCTFSMPDAVYCAIFVNTLHSLGTPFFNTVNHIDVLICKTLQPMICCCTEYEVGRLGRFLYETLKTAYHWKSDESVYELECGNMPGFAVYYRYPNSQRVTYGQFIKVHWKWSQRITRLLIQCLESAEYMEIRNALILLTKISGVFPVTRKTGINLEKRVAKIKNDEREDLKVLATGVAAALAARKHSWVSDEEFGMGYLELKPAPTLAPKLGAGNLAAGLNGAGVILSQNEAAGGRFTDSGVSVKGRPADIQLERTESGMHGKTDVTNTKSKGTSLSNGSEMRGGQTENLKQMDEPLNRAVDDNVTRVGSKLSEPESRASTKRSTASNIPTKTSRESLVKDDIKAGKTTGRSSTSDRDLTSRYVEGKSVDVSASVVVNGNQSTRLSAEAHNSDSKVETGSAYRTLATKVDNQEISDIPRSHSSRSMHSPRNDGSVASVKPSDKSQKRASPVDDSDRQSKYRKGDGGTRDSEEVRLVDRERHDRRLEKNQLIDLEKSISEDQSISKGTERAADRIKERSNERHDRDYRERADRSDKSHLESSISEKPRDRSQERFIKERSVERLSDRNVDRHSDKANSDAVRTRYIDPSVEKSIDDKFHAQGLPPPPPLPVNMVPHSVSGNKREEDVDRRMGSARHSVRLSPRHEEKERRRSEESLLSQDDAKRRKEDDARERKRDERDSLQMRLEGREREKAILAKDDLDAGSKRRKIRRDNLSVEAGEYTPSAPLSISLSQTYDTRERGDRKVSLVQQAGYLEEPSMRFHGKDIANKAARRDNDPMYDRDWDDEKRQRGADPKRRHRK